MFNLLIGILSESLSESQLLIELLLDTVNELQV
jgi:hypothetical protein